MELPLLRPLRDLLAAQAGDATVRAAATATTAFFAVVAATLVVAAGLVALAAVTGFPVAALAFAALFAALALAAHMVGRTRATRRAAQMASARNRVEADIALATALVRSARPLAPLAAFLAAFVLAQRR